MIYKPRKNRVGQKFGSLTVLKQYRDNKGVVKADCCCDCGTVKVYALGNVVNGRSSRCTGCQGELTRARKFKHGLSNTNLFKWWNINSRILVKKWRDDLLALVRDTNCPTDLHLGPKNPFRLIGPNNFIILDKFSLRLTDRAVKINGKMYSKAELSRVCGVSRQYITRLHASGDLLKWIKKRGVL